MGSTLRVISPPYPEDGRSTFMRNRVNIYRPSFWESPLWESQIAREKIYFTEHRILFDSANALCTCFGMRSFLLHCSGKMDTTSFCYKDTKRIFFILMVTYISINSLSREVSFHNMVKMKLCRLDKKVYVILIKKNTCSYLPTYT